MPTTPVYAYRYPAPTDPSDVPLDINELALDVEASVQARASEIAALNARVTTLEGQVGGFVLIGDVKVTVAQPTIDFSAIPQTYAALKLIAFLRGTDAANSRYMNMRVNDQATLYDWLMNIVSAASAPPGVEGVADVWATVAQITCAGTTAARFSPVEITIPNYTSTVGVKTWVTLWGMQVGAAAGGTRVGNNWGQWRPAAQAPITKVSLIPNQGNFDVGSRAMLYGVRGT